MMPAISDRRSRAATISGLHGLAPEPLPFAPSLEIRAFLLERPRGNILLYSTKGLAAERPAIEGLGGISRRYLNHRHEAIFTADGIDAPLFVHERERRSVERTDRVRATFSRRHHLDEDFEVIPTPGHTQRSHRVPVGQRRAPDALHGRHDLSRPGEWVAAVLGSSDRNSYIESLELIRELDFDLLVPWAATGGEPFYAHHGPG